MKSEYLHYQYQGLLADAFSAVLVVESASPISAPHQGFAGVLQEVYASPESVARELSNLSNSSAAGPDRLQSHLLKACSAALSLPSYFLFVRYIEERVLSDR